MTCRANGGSSCENENSKHRLRAKHRIIEECLPAAKRARKHPFALTNNSTRARIAPPAMRTPVRRDRKREIMNNHPTQSAGQTKWLLPAWVFSVAIHCAIFAVLCAKIQPWSKGSPNAQPGSIGLVLHNAGINGTDLETTPYMVQPASYVENVQPPELLAVSTTNSAVAEATANEPGTSQPQATANTVGTKKASA